MTKNFKKSEFACKCGCGESNIDPAVALVWQAVRDRFGPITISSGTRCVEHNKNEGGSENSQHLTKDDGYSKAADGHPHNATPEEVADWVKSVFPNGLGVGVYNGFVHIDIRHDRAYRWDG